jgi:hypothetical protein
MHKFDILTIRKYFGSSIGKVNNAYIKVDISVSLFEAKLSVWVISRNLKYEVYVRFVMLLKSDAFW